MNTRILAAPIGPALAQAASELAAAPAGSEEEWRLPDGDHELDAAITVDVTGRSLHLRGSDACRLLFATGGLVLRADTVDVRELGVETADGTAAVRIEAPRIRVADLDAAATGTAAVVAVDLDAGSGTIDADDVLVSRVAGTEIVALRALGGAVRVTGAVLRRLDGTTLTGVRVGALGDADLIEVEIREARATAGMAVGAVVAAGGRAEVARLRAFDLQGNGVLGVGVFGFGAGTGTLSAIDLEADGLVGNAGRAVGLYVAAPRRVAMRGFTVSNVSGGRAVGAVVVGGPDPGGVVERGPADVEVGFGRVERVVATGGDAAGLRVVVRPSPRPVIVRDMSVVEIAGAPVPGSATPARDAEGSPAWQGWGAGVLADLSDDATPRADAPGLLDVADVVGLAVTAMVDEVQPFLDEIDAGDLALVDSLVRTVSGSAVQIETGLRPGWVRRTEVSTALRAGFVQADQLVLAHTTWDRLGAPLTVGPGELRGYDSLFSRVSGGTGAPVTLDADAEWADARALFADTDSERFTSFGVLPYVAPGDAALPPALAAGTLPPREEIDLHVPAASALHARAVVPPPDDLDLSAEDRLEDRRLFVGAHPPDVPAPCELYDPLREPAAAAPAHFAGPAQMGAVVDYRARDAQALLGVMLERARLVMQPWRDRGPADFTTMLLEAVAERMDHLAYAQERAVAEGFLEDARLRRSVEDHVRPLDYDVDPGLSATVMLRFRLDLAGIARVLAARQREAAETTDAARAAFLTSTVAALEALASDGALEIPAGTLAANRSNDDQVIVFATEEPLATFPDLDAVPLVADLPLGATSARLAGALPELAVGRHLVLWRGVGRGGHVVRVTTLTRGTDVVEIGWDPRRPLPWPLPASADPATDTPAGIVLGNVVPAHHGVPLSALPADFVNPDLQGFRALLDMVVEGGPGLEVPLPFSPVSLQAPGYPLPGDEGRRGRPALRVLVDDDEWTRVDGLAGAGPSEEVFVLRASADGRATVRFGDGISGAALPARGNRLRFEVKIGAGRAGNVAEGVLARLLYVPVDVSRGPLTGWLFREDMEVLRGLLTVDNPVPGVGGRDPEPIDRARYRAPLLAGRPLSAVTAEDYARVARACPEVAAAHARVVRAAVRPVVRVTVLLRDEDTLDPDERLRRWAAVRAALENARLLGFDVESVPPLWAPLDLDVVVDAHAHAEAGAVRDAVIAAVAGDGGLLDPDTMLLGGDVQLADVYRAVLSAPGVAAARVRRFRRLQPHAPERLPSGVIPIGPDEVAIVRGPARPDADGVLTVSVCGGLR